MSELMLKVNDVSIRYRTGDCQSIGIKEFIMRKVTHTYHTSEFSAVQHVSFELYREDMLGIVGVNGSGKSTLLKAVSGIMPPTEGTIEVYGNVAALLELGSGFDGDLTVKENTFLRGALLGYSKKFILSKYQDIIEFAELTEFEDRPFRQLSSGMQARLAFSIASMVQPEVLILDEPTSSLTEKETARLFDLVKELSGRGISILYISHRMAEIFEICDRVTVFKDGTYVTTMDTGDICADDIIRAMVGRELGNLYPTKSSCIAADDPVLEVNGLTGSIFREVSFALRRGEILGFAGLVGAGRSEVMRGLCAIDPIRSGQVVLNGRPCAFHTYRDAVDAGICYLTEDRKTQGLFLEMSIKNNMSSANMKGVSHGIWLDDKLERSLANGFVEQLAIKIPGIEYPISSLSGGNQQKCLIGKWLSLAPKVIIMDEPTRGIDVGAKREIHALLRQLAESGVGVIVVSSELPEVIGVSDRVAVMHEGCLAGFLEGEEVREENIMKLASGEQLAEKELRQ